MEVRKLYQEIQQKYCLLDGVQELFLYETYLQVCKDFFEGKTYNRIVIYGAGRNTAELMESVIWEQLEDNIVVIVDNACEHRELKGIPIVKEEELKNYEIDVVLISSWNYRLEMTQSLKWIFPDMDVFEPYKYVLEKLPQINVPFFTYKGNYKYQWFATRIKELKSASQDCIRQKLLKELIHGYFSIYDWVDLKKAIMFYGESGYENIEKYRSLNKDVDHFLKVIQDEMERREQGDCIVFLVDALSKYVVEDMTHLSKWKESAVVFDKYINEYPSTREVIMALLTGWHPFEHKTYQSKKIRYNDSTLLKYIKEKNIEIKLVSAARSAANYSEISCYKRGVQEDTLCTEVIFRGVEELLGSEKRQLIILHFYDTIHPLHWNPVSLELVWNMDTSWAKHQKRFWESVAFTDDIINFYLEMFKTNKLITKIVMGDHGINLKTEYAHDIASIPVSGDIGLWDIETLSPALLIWHKDWQPKKICQLVSTSAFYQILYAVFEDQNVYTVLDNKCFLELDFVPGYDESWLKRVKKSNNYYLGMGAKGLILSEYIFLHFEDNSERLFKICGKSIVESNEELQEFIGIIGRETYDLCKFPKDILKEKIFEQHNKYYGGIKKRTGLRYP